MDNPIKDLCIFLTRAARSDRKLESAISDCMECGYDPIHLEKIKEVNLSGWKMTTLPKEISLLKNLRELRLTGCRLYDLPDEINELSHLTTIHLQGNNFMKFPKCLLNMKKIKVIYAANNPFLKELPIQLKDIIKEPLPSYSLWIDNKL